jgi:hypothetical protein
MAKYYYDVYDTIYASRWFNTSYIQMASSSTPLTGYTGCKFWPENGTYSNVGEYKKIYVADNDTTTYLNRVVGLPNTSRVKQKWHDIADRLYEYSEYRSVPDCRGEHKIETIIAEDGTYPDDGYDSTTGYWYVKGAIAFPAFHMKIDGQLKTSENGWVKIDGVLRPIEKIWVKINGELKVV